MNEFTIVLSLHLLPIDLLYYLQEFGFSFCNLSRVNKQLYCFVKDLFDNHQNMIQFEIYNCLLIDSIPTNIQTLFYRKNVDKQTIIDQLYNIYDIIAISKIIKQKEYKLKGNIIYRIIRLAKVFNTMNEIDTIFYIFDIDFESFKIEPIYFEIIAEYKPELVNYILDIYDVEYISYIHEEIYLRAILLNDCIHLYKMMDKRKVFNITGVFSIIQSSFPFNKKISKFILKKEKDKVILTNDFYYYINFWDHSIIKYCLNHPNFKPTKENKQDITYNSILGKKTKLVNKLLKNGFFEINMDKIKSCLHTCTIYNSNLLKEIINYIKRNDYIVDYEYDNYLLLKEAIKYRNIESFIILLNQESINPNGNEHFLPRKQLLYLMEENKEDNFIYKEMYTYLEREIKKRRAINAKDKQPCIKKQKN